MSGNLPFWDRPEDRDPSKAAGTPPEAPAPGFAPPQAPPPSAPPPQGAYGQPPYVQQGYPPPVYVVNQTKTNGFAIAALVLGIVWIYWVGSILALVFGYIANSQIEKSGGQQTGKGMAIAGIVLGWIGVGILLFILAFGVIGAGL